MDGPRCAFVSAASDDAGAAEACGARAVGRCDVCGHVVCQVHAIARGLARVCHRCAPPRIPAPRCEQHGCAQPREFGCAACGKPVCVDHLRFGRVPARDAAETPSVPTRPAVYLCSTCAALEAVAGVAAGDLEAATRAATYARLDPDLVGAWERDRMQ